MDAEPIVVALGAHESFYACWKDKNGNYRQGIYESTSVRDQTSERDVDSNNLPDRLQEWLFPKDGSMRDLETLQVVLGRESEFYARDRDGAISHINSSMRQMALQRSDSWPRKSGITNRKRAMTLSSTTSNSPGNSLIDGFRSTESPIVPEPRSRRPSSRSFSRTARPLSFITTPSPGMTRPSSVSVSSESSGATFIEDVNLSNRWSNVTTKEWDQRPQYADAAAQTDAETNPDSTAQPERTTSSESDWSMINMQAYFRSQDYQLGDFFRAISVRAL